MELTARAGLVLTLLLVTPASAAVPSARLRLLLAGPQDVSDPWGRLHLAVTPIRLMREVGEPPFSPIG